MLKWIAGRLDGTADAVDTPIGRVPTKASLDLSGLSIADAALETLLSVDAEVWAEEAALIPDFYNKFGDRLPAQLWDQHAALTQRLGVREAAE